MRRIRIWGISPFPAVSYVAKVLLLAPFLLRGGPTSRAHTRGFVPPADGPREPCECSARRGPSGARPAGSAPSPRLSCCLPPVSSRLHVPLPPAARAEGPVPRGRCSRHGHAVGGGFPALHHTSPQHIRLRGDPRHPCHRASCPRGGAPWGPALGHWGDGCLPGHHLASPLQDGGTASQPQPRRAPSPGAPGAPTSPLSPFGPEGPG